MIPHRYTTNPFFSTLVYMSYVLDTVVNDPSKNANGKIAVRSLGSPRFICCTRPNPGAFFCL